MHAIMWQNALIFLNRSWSRLVVSDGFLILAALNIAKMAKKATEEITDVAILMDEFHMNRMNARNVIVIGKQAIEIFQNSRMSLKSGGLVLFMIRLLVLFFCVDD